MKQHSRHQHEFNGQRQEQDRAEDEATARELRPVNFLGWPKHTKSVPQINAYPDTIRQKPLCVVSFLGMV